MFRTWPLIGLPLAAACTDGWPRFDDDGPKLRPYGGQIALSQTVVEDEDFPCLAPSGSPAEACIPDVLDLLDLDLKPFYGVRIQGTASPAGIYTELQSSSPFFGIYTGDVDWVRFKNPGGTVCLLLETYPYEQSLWDVVAYAYGDGIVGDFVTRPCEHDPQIPDSCENDPRVPLSIAVGGCEQGAGSGPAALTGCTWFSSDSPEIALYVASAEAEAVNVDYLLYLYATTFESGCNDLTPKRFVEAGSGR